MNNKVSSHRKLIKSSNALPQINSCNDLNKHEQIIINQKPQLKKQLAIQGGKMTLSQFNKTTFIRRDSPFDNLNQYKTIQNENLFNLNADISFETYALQSKIKISKAGPITIPAMISLITKDIVLEQDQGLDLICVIDRSMSMQGEKLQMVKETLKTLINQLSQKDRLSVISFNESNQILFKLNKVTEEKKEKMKQKIDNITAEGGTFIAGALYKAMKQLRERKQSNLVTSVFLLSDGQDQESEAVLDQVFLDISFPYTLHSFGYGNDHDSQLLTKISLLGNGNFYFVQNLQLLDEFFVDALGGLMSVVGQSITIDVFCQSKAPYDKVFISQTYGAMWNEKIEHTSYQIKLPLITTGQRKDFVFELTLPEIKGRLRMRETYILPIIAVLKIQCPQTKQIYTKYCNLQLCLTNDQQLKTEYNLDVAVQYYRVKGTEIIEGARQKCELGNYEEAKNLLKYMIQELNKNESISKQLNYIMEDLKQAYQASEQLQYYKYGQTLMMQMVNNNYNQSGMTAQFTSDGTQHSSPQTYSNAQSRNMVSLLLSSKSTTSGFD